MNDNDELSLEQKNRLYGMAFIPFIIVFFVLAGYFLFYFVENNLVESIWDGFIYFVLPLFLIGPPSSFLAFEVLHHREIKQPLILHVKRFSGRVLLTIPAVLSFCGVLAAAHIFLSPIIGETHISMVGGAIWIVGFSVVLVKFREFFIKLNRGEW